MLLQAIVALLFELVKFTNGFDIQQIINMHRLGSTSTYSLIWVVKICEHRKRIHPQRMFGGAREQRSNAFRY